jgi:2-phospho-L-lactate/phosphoenolpyruvate guanylyltransferase
MPSFVVPFRGPKGKSRLGALPARFRNALAYAMLQDVLAACDSVGPAFVVGPTDLAINGASFVPDPGDGQGAAVSAGLNAAAIAAASAGRTGPLVVVNADLPCVTARDLLALAGAVPDGGLAYAPAADGTTNALALSSPDLFAPVYGRDSAARFAALAPSHRVEAPNLMDDVDTIADLERLSGRVGPHTRKALASLRAGAAA